MTTTQQLEAYRRGRHRELRRPAPKTVPAAVDRGGRCRLGAVGRRRPGLRRHVASGAGRSSRFDAAGTTGCGGAPKICAPLFTITLPDSSLGSVAVSRLDRLRADADSVRSWPRDATGALVPPGIPRCAPPLWTTASDRLRPRRTVRDPSGVGRSRVRHGREREPTRPCSRVRRGRRARAATRPPDSSARSIWDSGRGRSHDRRPTPSPDSWPTGWSSSPARRGIPAANPGCSLTMRTAPLAWTAPAGRTSATVTTIAYGTAVRPRSGTRSLGLRVVAYHLSLIGPGGVLSSGRAAA